MNIYLIGSLRNPEIPAIANRIEKDGHWVFSDWHAAGERGDDSWRDYEKARGHTYLEALDGLAANHVFQFDLKHLTECDAAILVYPAGRSAHLELGWVLGRGKKGYILLDNPDRWDIMVKFATAVHTSLDTLLTNL